MCMCMCMCVCVCVCVCVCDCVCACVCVCVCVCDLYICMRICIDRSKNADLFTCNNHRYLHDNVPAETTGVKHCAQRRQSHWSERSPKMCVNYSISLYMCIIYIGYDIIIHVYHIYIGYDIIIHVYHINRVWYLFLLDCEILVGILSPPGYILVLTTTRSL